MMNLLIWRTCFMFFALELVKKRRWKRKESSERNILQKKPFQRLSEKASKTCICSPASQTMDIFRLSILVFLSINIFKFGTFLLLLFCMACWSTKFPSYNTSTQGLQSTQPKLTNICILVRPWSSWEILCPSSFMRTLKKRKAKPLPSLRYHSENVLAEHHPRCPDLLFML